MFSFFLRKNHNIATPLKKYSKFDWIRRRYEFEINKITDYYTHRTRAVNNTNLFSRMIFLLQPNLDLDIATYFRYVDQNSEYLARQFKMVSNISKGSVYKNLFYKDNSYAIVNYVENDINIFTIGDSWRELVPLRMIYTNSTSVDFYQMDKTRIPEHQNLTVCELDVNMMLLQYRYWAKERLRDDFSTNPNVYVYQMLYPRFVNSGIDIALFNRLMALYYNYSIEENDIRHPFHVLDYTNGIDSIYKEVLSHMDKGNMMLEQMLRMIPTLYYDNMLDALYINRPIYTRQSEWSIWVSRLKYFNFLIDLMGPRGISRNRMYLYNLPTLIRQLENRSTDLTMVLSNDLLSMVYTEIEKIKTKIGRR